MFGGDTPSESEIEVLKSRFVLGEVVKAEHLDIIVTPVYFPIIGQAIARRYTPSMENENPLNKPFIDFGKFAWGGEIVTIERFQLPDNLINTQYTLVAGQAGQYQLLLNDQVVLEGQVGESAASANQQVRLFISELRARPGTEFILSRQPLVTAVQSLTNRLSVSERGSKTGILSLSLTGPDKDSNAKELNAITQRYLYQNVERVSAEAQNSLDFLEQQLPAVKEELELSENKLNRYRLQNQTIDLTLEN